MIIEQFLPLLDRIHGCTFASLDAETKVGGLRRVVTNERVILFTNKNGSGYENKVNRMLQKAGKPADFTAADLPWGDRVPDTPLISHRGFVYLQTVLIATGHEQYYLGERLIPPSMVRDFIKPQQRGPVVVNTYALENIKAIRLLGESLVDPEAPRPRRKILGIK